MFFCSWGIWWSFFSRWLTDPAHGLGMTSAEQGQIYSINSLATLVIMFAYGAIQDQLGIKRKLVIFVSAIAALVGPFVQFVYAPMLTAGGTTRFIGVLIGSIVLSAGFMAGCSLFEALTERYSRKFGFEYGQSRAWGSFGYAIVALCAGFLFNINPLLNFWVGSICGLGMRLRLLGSGRAKGRTQEGGRSERGSDQPVLQGNDFRSEDADPVGAHRFHAVHQHLLYRVRSADVPELLRFPLLHH